MRVITDLDELDEQLIRLDQLNAISDAALREGFNEFCMDIPAVHGLDPDSEEYRDKQMAIYERLAGKTYTPANEVSDLDPINLAAVPFPYYTQGWEVIGDQLIAVGFIMKTMKLAAGSSILEFGPGWGNTTIALARSGYKVTCIEIEQNFVELIKLRAARKSIEVEVIKGDFLDARSLGRRFDAVLFFECFHHCARHNELLDSIDNLVNPDGIVVFAAEPITDDFYAPWGIRSDGQTLWAIRKFGWMELGFTESYFRKSMKRRGWTVERFSSDASSLATVFVARRSNAIAAVHDGFDDAAKPVSDPAEALTTTLGQEVLSGPEWVKRILRPVTPILVRRFLIKVLRRISG
jgi:2-polyprenyl-3-methyl-5-hydroxy-6-metoxy-1,4-benzoquinol methylase